MPCRYVRVCRVAAFVWVAGMGLAATARVAAEAEPSAREASHAALERQRKEAAHRRRRIIMNDDGNAGLTAVGEPRTHENYLSKRIASLANSQVDAIFLCTGVFNTYNHHSTVTEPRIVKPRMRGEGPALARFEDWAWELGNRGPDTLTTVVNFGHGHDMEVFWSMRMNDTHDASDPSVLCQWKRNHPHCLMGKPGDRFVAGGNRWSALNYETPEVREQVLRILRDVVTRYDVDGLELDFMRSPVYFRPQMMGKPVTQRHRDLMTDMLRQVRELADETAARRGRPVLIVVRTPDSVEFASALGLDLARWLKEDLIDVLVVGCFYQLNPWETSVTLGHQYGVPVYPSLSEPRFRNRQSQEARESLECYRGRALDAWNAGADGIYMFNYSDPHSPLWRELGDREALQTRDQLYPAGTMSTSMIGWLADGRKWMRRPAPLPERPVKVVAGGKATIEIPVAAALSAKSQQNPKTRIRLLVADPATANGLAAKLNDRPLSADRSLDGWLVYWAESSSVKLGTNRLELTVPTTGSDVKILDAMLEILHTPAAGARQSCAARPMAGFVLGDEAARAWNRAIAR